MPPLLVAVRMQLLVSALTNSDAEGCHCMYNGHNAALL